MDNNKMLIEVQTIEIDFENKKLAEIVSNFCRKKLNLRTEITSSGVEEFVLRVYDCKPEDIEKIKRHIQAKDLGIKVFKAIDGVGGGAAEVIGIATKISTNILGSAFKAIVKSAGNTINNVTDSSKQAYGDLAQDEDIQKAMRSFRMGGGTKRGIKSVPINKNNK